jgi:hypothetical protein
LPSNDTRRYTCGHTEIKSAVEMDVDATIYILSFIRTGLGQPFKSWLIVLNT